MMRSQALNYDTHAASVLSGLECLEPGRAIQSQKDEADINTIVKRFGITGMVPQGLKAPKVGDFDGIFDFQTAMNAIVEADRSFMQLPADTRSRFGNDPGRFVDFCTEQNDDGSLKNRDELVRLGLSLPADVPPEVAPMRVEVINDGFFSQKSGDAPKASGSKP